MNDQNRPGILMAFSNPDENLKLGKEFAPFQSIFISESKNKIEFIAPLTEVTVQGIHDTFLEKPTIAIFHYAGHANKSHLLFKEKLSDGKNLNDYLAKRPNLQLVVLNACETFELATDLVRKGISVVVATNRPVQDEIAALFTKVFYQNLLKGTSYREAFDNAITIIQDHVNEKKVAAYRGSVLMNEDAEPGTEYALITKEPKTEGLTFAEMLKDPYYGLPDLPDFYYDNLPRDSPYLSLKPYTENEAALFFGRGWEIRSLFQAISKSTTKTHLLYGSSGVGKSSLLNAGLLTRLNAAGYSVIYKRRKNEIDLVATLKICLECEGDDLQAAWVAIEEKDKGPLVIVLDQIEEAYTNRKPKEIEDLARAIKALFTSGEKSGKRTFIPKESRVLGKLILGYREEFHARIQNVLDNHQVPYRYQLLEPLSHDSIHEIVEGISENRKLLERFPLKIEDGLPKKIADKLSNDPTAAISPVLQILLTNLWERTSRDKTGTRLFTSKLFIKLSNEGIWMGDFLDKQLKSVRTVHPDEEAAGLVLDILNFLTTDLGSAGSVSFNALNDQYTISQEELSQLLQTLSDFYLIHIQNENSTTIYRLSHDTLGPLVRKLHSESNRPVQRATRILDSKKEDIKTWNGTEILFSEVDLKALEEGRKGMRKWLSEEKAVFEDNREQLMRQKAAIEERQRELAQKNIELDRQSKKAVQALAEGLAKEAEISLKNNNEGQALRLAERAYFYSNNKYNILHYLIKSYNKKLPYYIELKAHIGAVNSASFSQDGNYILTCSDDHTARIWNRFGQSLATLEGYTDFINSAVFSPDGELILTISRDGTARLWDRSSQCVFKLNGNPNFCVNSAVFSPDGFHILMTDRNTARLWGIDGQQISTLEGHKDRINSAVFSPDGSLILTSSDDLTARLWDRSGQLIATLEGHSNSVHSAIFSPDGFFILTAGWENTARLWSINGQSIITLEGHTHNINSAVFSPDSSLILTASDDLTARMWDRSGKLLTILKGHTKSVNSAVFSPDGSIILTAGWENTARLWSIDGQHIATLEGHTESIRSAVFSPDGSLILTASEDRTARLWDRINQPIATLKEHSESVQSAVFSPDGSLILTVTWDKTASVWDRSGQPIATLKGHTDYINSAVFSPDGSLILTASDDKTARLWDCSGQPIAIFEEFSEPVKSAAFSPDGAYILTASNDKTSRLWNRSGQLILTLEGPVFYVRSAVFSSDGSFILAASYDKNSYFYLAFHYTSGTGIEYLQINKPITPFYTLRGHKSFVNSAVFSPDGSLILTASDDSTVRLWEPSGKLLGILEEHKSFVNSAVFSPDGSLILTASRDKTAILWDQVRQSTSILEGHTDNVNSAVFSPDASIIMTASSDKTVRFWHINPDLIIEDLQQRNITGLSWQEMQQYNIDLIEQSAGIDMKKELLEAEPDEYSLYNYARYYYEIARKNLEERDIYKEKSLRLYERLIEHWQLKIYQDERKIAKMDPEVRSTGFSTH